MHLKDMVPRSHTQRREDNKLMASHPRQLLVKQPTVLCRTSRRHRSLEDILLRPRLRSHHQDMRRVETAILVKAQTKARGPKPQDILHNSSSSLDTQLSSIHLHKLQGILRSNSNRLDTRLRSTHLRASNHSTRHPDSSHSSSNTRLPASRISNTELRLTEQHLLRMEAIRRQDTSRSTPIRVDILNTRLLASNLSNTRLPASRTSNTELRLTVQHPLRMGAIRHQDTSRSTPIRVDILRTEACKV